MRSRVLVTGATGKLGTAVCHALLGSGFEVCATDRRHARDFPVKVELGDLCDELFVYRALEGARAVVHLGNHPNAFIGLSPQRLLAENMAMNANVFRAAVDLGLKTIVFSSSVQVTLPRHQPAGGPPYSIPYLPLDGALPQNPGSNAYAQSKEFAERLLQLLVEADPTLSATAIRFPMLVGEWLVRRFSSARRMPLEFVDFTEGTAHLFLEDAGRIVADVLDRSLAGYHQYFPAQTMDLRGYPLSELVRERYPNVELRCPLESMQSLIDVSSITRDLGWTPHERLSVEVER
jgi:nucleoside-diphosphate-sugar epimerase